MPHSDQAKILLNLESLVSFWAKKSASGVSIFFFLRIPKTRKKNLVPKRHIESENKTKMSASKGSSSLIGAKKAVI